MAELKVFRANHQDMNYMGAMIEEVWENIDNVICKFSIGVSGNNVVDIYNSFEMVQKAAGKKLFIKVHCFSLDFEDIEDENTVREVVSNLLDTIKDTFQVIAVLYVNKYGSYECVFLINAVSYITYNNFHDNNATYIELIKYLRYSTGLEWNVDVSENVLFKNDSNESLRYQAFE